MADSVLEEDLMIEGNIRSGEGTVDVKGKVTGDVKAHTVTLHQGGLINGELAAKNVTIEGTHKGSLQCEDLTLAATSDLNAKVSAQTMTTETGAKIAGTISITGRK